MHNDAVSPEGNVHFAGEHASLDTGWIQGAVSSALRAVGEIVAG
jgi:monoamine oxidase